MPKRKPTHVYVVHELYWNAEPMHRDPTMMPLDADTFKRLPKEGVGSIFCGLPGLGRRIISVQERCFDNPMITLLELE